MVLAVALHQGPGRNPSLPGGFNRIDNAAAPVYTRTQAMGFEWDAQKAKRNAAKHGVHFGDAVSVLEDERALTMADLSEDDEQRWIALGADALGRVLVVVYTWRKDRVRIISARPATPGERNAYAEGL